MCVCTREKKRGGGGGVTMGERTEVESIRCCVFPKYFEYLSSPPAASTSILILVRNASISRVWPAVFQGAVARMGRMRVMEVKLHTLVRFATGIVKRIFLWNSRSALDNFLHRHLLY